MVLILSFSGETDEITRLLPCLSAAACPIVAVTSQATSTLGQAADCVLQLGNLQEADPLRLAPTTSTTAMLALGDALALAAAQQRQFAAEDFAKFHPGGSLGRKLAKVEEVMRPADACRVSHESETVRQVLVDVGRPGRRTGAIMLVDDHNRLRGVFTDSDLARLFEDHRESALDQPIADVMCESPATINKGAMLSQAIDLLAKRKISELPVIDARGCPVGLIDITDVVSTPTEHQVDGRAMLFKLFQSEPSDHLDA
jgi:arabinose-5-phosphate isomerase